MGRLFVANCMPILCKMLNQQDQYIAQEYLSRPTKSRGVRLYGYFADSPALMRISCMVALGLKVIAYATSEGLRNQK